MSRQDCVRLFRSLNVQQPKRPDTMVFGTIVSTSPLKIQIADDVILNESHLFLGRMLRPQKVTIPHTHKYSGTTENKDTSISVSTVITGNAGSKPVTATATNTVSDPQHAHDIKDQETDDVHEDGCGTDYESNITLTIYPELASGDVVLMFAFNDYQMYYVAERIGE